MRKISQATVKLLDLSFFAG